MVQTVITLAGGVSLIAFGACCWVLSYDASQPPGESRIVARAGFAIGLFVMALGALLVRAA